MILKHILLIIVLVSLLSPALATPATDAATTAISSGIKGFFIELSDTIFDMSFSGYDDSEGYKTEGYIFNIASYTPNPFQSPVVQDFIVFSKSIFKSAYPILLLCAFIAVLLTHYKTNALQEFEQMTGVNIGSKSNILVKKAIDGIVVAVFMYIAIFFVLTLNNILTKAVMGGVLDSVSPTPDNFILYLIMALCYLVMGFFFTLRTLILFLFCGFALIIGFCLLIDYTKESAIGLCAYFTQVVFFQFITVLYFSASILIIKALSHGAHDSDMLMYTVMLLGGVYLGIKMMFGTKIIRFVGSAGKKVLL